MLQPLSIGEITLRSMTICEPAEIPALLRIVRWRRRSPCAAAGTLLTDPTPVQLPALRLHGSGWYGNSPESSGARLPDHGVVHQRDDGVRLDQIIGKSSMPTAFAAHVLRLRVP